MAPRHGIRLKLTLEHFREMSESPRQRWANKPLHLVANGGTATNMADFFSGAASRERFPGKLAWFAGRYGDDPMIFGWELWNEINAVRAGADHFMPWTEMMLTELHRRFPRNLAMQSLGSFDTAGVRDLYRRHSLLPGNDVAQVHRYLDLGAAPRGLSWPGGFVGGRRRTRLAGLPVGEAGGACRKRRGGTGAQRAVQTLRRGQGRASSCTTFSSRRFSRERRGPGRSGTGMCTWTATTSGITSHGLPRRLRNSIRPPRISSRWK